MARFSSRASEALTKVLKGRNLPAIRNFVSAMEEQFKGDSNKTTSIEASADHVLSSPAWQHGQRMQPGYNMESKLVAGIDGPDIARALAVGKSVLSMVMAERAAWVLEEEKKHRPIHGGTALKFKEDPTHGPGTSSWVLSH